MKLHSICMRAGLSALVSGVIFAGSLQAQEAQSRYAKAAFTGMQNALSQRMSRAMCFVSIESYTQEHLEMLKQAKLEFSENLDTLSVGDPSLGILAATDLDELDALDEMFGSWDTLIPIIDRVLIEGYATTSDIAEMALLGRSLARASDAMANSPALAEGLAEDAKGVLKLIAVATNQAMLLQRSAKEACLIQAGIDVTTNQTGLKETAKAFQTGANLLVYGKKSQGVPLLRDPDIASLSREVSQDWVRMGIYFAKAQRGTQDLETMASISEDTEPVLKDLRALIAMYRAR
ncbi:type IV pili methyl-accepting chemotaxis transducer N-terminal domain-containing protein [Candidatus Halocynthiibacter alkanivorans]|uniref:type IV pili methyl-accepting chemotaxis transducer N-terminal domain-containing protein n=1 Tax=Candidatus Halocynthiibacter alkanivorans TaxID=2267619 RepID=UPI000DF15BAB|nr:type IV pili methyl-accepting chemotaxis transducer N-terminal domain-containing protein [Candidatus Halocynthiibacter alkanivorans]